MLAVPLGGQFEQMLNARYLQHEGYGLAAEELSPERLGEFLERLPDFERKLAGYQQNGNQDLFLGLEQSLTAATRKTS